MKLFLVSKETLKTRVPIPGEVTADVSLRRRQQFRIRPGEKIEEELCLDAGTRIAGTKIFASDGNS